MGARGVFRSKDRKGKLTIISGSCYMVIFGGTVIFGILLCLRDTIRGNECNHFCGHNSLNSQRYTRPLQRSPTSFYLGLPRTQEECDWCEQSLSSTLGFHLSIFSLRKISRFIFIYKQFQYVKTKLSEMPQSYFQQPPFVSCHGTSHHTIA